MKIQDIAFHNVADFNQTRLQQSLSAKDTLVVRATDPAVKIAAKADKLNTRLIVVTTDEKTQISGLIAPAEWKKKYSQYRSKDFGSLQDALEDVLADPIDQARGFHHEWLNHERPTLFWCIKGSHYTDEDPCSRHGAQ
jgi:hypothetical protein